MNLQSLKERVTSVMPILNANLSAANAEWMSGNIPRGAFEYCLLRHGIALELLSLDDSDIVPERAYLACAPITIDLRDGLEDMQDKTQADSVMKAWLDCFRAAGFTEMHRIFDFPVKPVDAEAR